METEEQYNNKKTTKYTNVMGLGLVVLIFGGVGYFIIKDKLTNNPNIFIQETKAIFYEIIDGNDKTRYKKIIVSDCEEEKHNIEFFIQGLRAHTKCKVFSTQKGISDCRAQFKKMPSYQPAIYEVTVCK